MNQEPTIQRSSRTMAARIHKLAGQLAAIERMVQTKRSCPEVLAQIEAVRSGLGGIAAIVVSEELFRMSKKRTLESREIMRLTKTFIKGT